MKLRIDPISLIVISILAGWAWYEATNEPVCYVNETVDGKEVIKPVYCKNIYKD